VYITKAHANAKSAYVVSLNIDKKKHTTIAKPELVYINENILLDSATNIVVEKWSGIAEKNYGSLGFDARKIVLTEGEPLDGRETEVRRHSTNLTKLIVSSIHSAAPQAEVVFMNSGSIRLDDVLQMPATEYDIIRTLPFGGGIQEVDIKGSLLIQTLEQGEKNRGSGGYLQYNENVIKEAGTWKIQGVPIDLVKAYHVAMTDFLFTGKEANFDFLNPKNPGVIKIYETASLPDARSDVRLAVIRYLEKKNNP